MKTEITWYQLRNHSFLLPLKLLYNISDSYTNHFITFDSIQQLWNEKCWVCNFLRHPGDNSIKGHCWHFLNLLGATVFYSNPVPCQLLAADIPQKDWKSISKTIDKKLLIIRHRLLLQCQLFCSNWAQLKKRHLKKSVSTYWREMSADHFKKVINHKQ